LTVLRAKHPPRAVYSRGPAAPTANLIQSQSPSPHPSLVLQQREVIDAIKSFPAGSAGGLDGLCPQHLKDVIGIQDEAGHHLGSSLTDFANLCLGSGIPLAIRPVFCGAALCALNKKDFGIRPIAVGLTLRRLVAKAVLDKVAAKMAPTQIGLVSSEALKLLLTLHADSCLTCDLDKPC